MAFYDYIRIYGLPESDAEEFQGLCAAALYNAADAQPNSGGNADVNSETDADDSADPGVTISEGLWTAQSNLITQQSAYLDDIKATFTEKREDLHVSFTMKQFTESKPFKYLADIAVKKVTDWLTDAYPGVADDAILDTIATYTPKAMGWALVWLDKQFLAGGILCERMKEENTQLLTMTSSFDAYKLRSEILSQHDLTVQSLLSQVALVEGQVRTGGETDLSQILNGALYAQYDPKFGTTLGWKYQAGLTTHLNKALFFKDKEGLNEDIGLATLVKDLSDKIDAMTANAANGETVVQCPHTGDYIYTKSLAKVSR